MPRPLSDIVPPTMRKRMETMKIRSLKQLSVRVGRAETAVGDYLKSNKPSLALLVAMLKELGYTCSSPEFDLINELIDAKGLQSDKDSPIISKPVRIKQYSFRQSRWPKAA